MGAAQLLLGRLWSELVPVVPDDECFAWHELPLSEFFAGIDVARRVLIDRHKCWSGEERFLDVGSGVGSKLLLASAHGWRPEGLEMRPAYTSVSRRLFPEFPVYDGRAEDFCRYADFDLIYMYRLFVDLDAEAKLIAHVMRQMKSGALLFHAGGPSPVDRRHVGDLVWEA